MSVGKCHSDIFDLGGVTSARFVVGEVGTMSGGGALTETEAPLLATLRSAHTELKGRRTFYN
jgi:hypothetical protein